jgi:hypothetical protein
MILGTIKRISIGEGESIVVVIVVENSLAILLAHSNAISVLPVPVLYKMVPL